MMHFLWTMMFLKVYATEEVMRKLTGGADQKTICKWVHLFIGAISGPEFHLVSQHNSFQGHKKHAGC